MIIKLFILLALCLPALFYLLTPGFYEPQDLHHIADIYQMIRAVESGQFPPRLGPDFMFGYGYPLFNFYYPLPFYLGALFFFLGGSLTLSFKLVFIIGILASVIGMYLFLKEFLDEWGATVGSILFLYTPYRAVQVYVRGAMGESLALSLLPFFAWSVVRLLKRPSLKKTALVGIIGAIFILSHNYFWALSGFWIIALVFIVKYKRNLVTIAKLLLGGIISLGLSAYWLIPALIEQKLVSSITPFPLIDHFPFVKQLLLPFWGYGASLWGPDDGMSFQVGIVNLIVSACLILYIVFFFHDLKRKNIHSLSIWVLVGILVNVFLMNIRSYPIWKLLPFHNFIQFPWRLLSFTSFFSSIAAGIIVFAVPEKRKHIVGILIAAGSILLTVNYFRPSQKFYKSDNDYLNRFFANRSLAGRKDGISNDYLLYSEDYLQLPVWVKERPGSIPSAKISSNDSVVFSINEITPVVWEANIESGNLGTVTFHEMYFPGWTSEVDGVRVVPTPSGTSGEMAVNIKSSGIHKVRFFWGETTLREIADLISLGAFITVVFMFIFSKAKK